MSEYVTRIRTNNGDLPIDYNALANRPDAKNVKHPTNTQGVPLYGATGQFAVSDGHGGITWTDFPTGGSDWDMLIKTTNFTSDAANYTVVKGNATDVFTRCKAGEQLKVGLLLEHDYEDPASFVISAESVKASGVLGENEYSWLNIVFGYDDSEDRQVWDIHFDNDGIENNTVYNVRQKNHSESLIVKHPTNAWGGAIHGEVGQFAVSDGNGGVTWTDLPSHSSGSSVDATINVVVDDGMNASPTTLTIDNIQYDESEIVNLANKMGEDQDVNVKIYGEYCYWSSSGFYGNFKPLHILYDYPNLVVTFMLDHAGTFVMYRLRFGVKFDDSNSKVKTITSAVLDRVNSEGDATIFINCSGYDLVELDSNQIQFDEYEIKNVIDKLGSGQKVRVRIHSEHNHASGSGWYGEITPTYVESDGHSLYIHFELNNSEYTQSYLYIKTLYFRRYDDGAILDSVWTRRIATEHV